MQKAELLVEWGHIVPCYVVAVEFLQHMNNNGDKLSFAELFCPGMYSHIFLCLDVVVYLWEQSQIFVHLL